MDVNRIEYKVLTCVGYTLQIEIWKEEGCLHYSWKYPFVNSRKLNQVSNMVSEVSVEELNEKITILKREFEIQQVKYVMDPCFYSLILFDREGEIASYDWSDDDHIPDELSQFLDFIGSVIGDAPFLPV